MRAFEYSSQFKKDLKKAEKQTAPKRDIDELKSVTLSLAKDAPLSAEKRDHPLVGSWKGYRECHIQPDFLLIDKKDNERNAIRFERLGSHSELFR